MAEVKNYQEVVDIASKHLGKVGGDGYKDLPSYSAKHTACKCAGC